MAASWTPDSAPYYHFGASLEDRREINQCCEYRRPVGESLPRPECCVVFMQHMAVGSRNAAGPSTCQDVRCPLQPPKLGLVIK